MQVNYHILFEETILKLKKEKKKPTLLLHACCGVCGSSVFERLIQDFNVTVYFYNPNIQPLKEYLRRRDELIDFLAQFNRDYNSHVTFVEGPYEVKKFLKRTQPFKNNKEGSTRCGICFATRLEQSFIYATRQHFDYITTVLTVSRHKNSQRINQIAKGIATHYPSITYLYSDFKKKEGTKRSQALASLYNMYRQDYCGCAYSLRDTLSKQASKKDHDI